MALHVPRVFSLTRVQRFAIAILGVIVAAALRLALDPILEEDLPLFLFIFPIVLSCWLGGLWPGLLATALSLVLGDYFFMTPRGLIFQYGTLNLTRALFLGALGTALAILFDRVQKAVRGHLECLERFRLLVESAKDYEIFTTDPEGRVTCWSDGAVQIVGYKSNEVVGQNFSMFYTPEEVLSGTPRSELEIAAAKGRFEVEKWQERKDGSRFWASSIITPLRDRGHLRGFARVTRDMTERKRAEEALRASQQFANRVIDVSPSVIYIYDVQQRKNVFRNRGVLMTLGYPIGQEAPDDEFIRSVMHPDSRQPFLNYLEQFAGLTDDATTECEYRMRHRNGEWRWFHSRDKVFSRNEDGSVKEVIGTATDITERKGAEDKIRFMADLNESFQALADPEQIIALAVRKLGEHLDVDRCSYAEIEADQNYFVIKCDYARGAAASTIGRYPMSEFGANERQTLFENLPYVVHDIEAETPAVTDLSLYRRREIRSMVSVPLNKDGKFLARMTVQQSSPRRWSSQEIHLITAVANRCWESVERAVALRNLKEGDDRYRAFIANSSEAIWRFELERPIPVTLPEDEQFELAHQYAYLAECNDAMAHMYGYGSRDEILGLRPSELNVRADGQNITFFRELKRVDYRLTDFETREVDRYGNTKYFLNNVIGFQEDGAIVRFWGTQRNITEQKHAAEALRFSEERLRRISEATQDALWEIDLKTRLLWWSEGARPLFGHSPGQLEIGLEDWYRGIHADDVERVRPGFENFLKGPETYWADEYRFRRADGVYVYIQDRGQKFYDEHGSAVRIAGAMVDITKRKLSEEALRESEERFSKAFSASPDSLVISRVADGLILDVNDSFVALTGYDRSEMLGKTTAELGIFIDPADRERAVQMLREKNYVRDMEVLMRFKAGRIRLVSFSALPLELRGEQCWLTIGRDITESRLAEQERERFLLQEKTAREEAETASRMKDEFLATISHELRTPLTAILGWARMLADGLLSEPQTRHALNVIVQSAKSQTQLIDDILDTSRIITGRFKLDAHPVEVEEVLLSAVDVIRPSADAKGISISVLITDHGNVVLGDAKRLQQAIWNVLANAVKFTNEGGSIEARLARAGELVEIAISDTGVGIDPEFLPYVFERFRQADSTSTRKYGGLGLGLAIVRYVVEMHGGSASVSSTGKGYGATFVLRLPLVARARLRQQVDRTADSKSAEQPAKLERERLRSLRVLVVDDDPDTLDMLKFVLADCGADVKTAASTSEAIEVFENWRPEVLVSDIAMPGQDGYELIEQVRSHRPESGGNIPAVALTAHARAEDRVRILAAGFQMHVPKPVEPEELVAVVSSLTGRVP